MNHHVGPLTGNITEMRESVAQTDDLHDPAKGQLLQQLDSLGDHIFSMEFSWMNTYLMKSPIVTSALTSSDIHVVPTPPAG